MSLASRALGRLMQLPPASVHAVRVHRDVEIITRDGVVLRADHYEPRLRGAPTILIRTPYGRRGLVGLGSGRILAERGFHVLLQSCRGTFDSGGGRFTPMRHEREDGLDTLAWLRQQPWYNGELFTYGPSYLGFTQWAIAAEAGPELKGMLLVVTASAFRDPTYAGGAYSLDTILNWATITANQGGSTLSFMVKQNRAQARLRQAFRHLPLAELDALVSGREIAFYQEWLTHTEQGDPYWLDRGHDTRIGDVTAAISMIGGWYDIFLPWQLRDYAALRAAGRQPRLTIGPWSHGSLALITAGTREAIRFFHALRPGATPVASGVRIYVGGADEWRRVADWPPHADTEPWYLHSGGGLAPTGPAGAGEPDRFRYDPADPTPSPGGPLLTREGGRVDNRPVESRADVLVYSSAVLDQPVEAVGPVRARVHIRSNLEHFDVFLRVCDVAPDGRSENITDGLVRVVPGTYPPDADGVRAVDVELWPVAYRWLPGHRIRVQLAGGAHPRYARNPGSGEPLARATTLRVAENEVFFAPGRPTALLLPVARADQATPAGARASEAAPVPAEPLSP